MLFQTFWSTARVLRRARNFSEARLVADVSVRRRRLSQLTWRAEQERRGAVFTALSRRWRSIRIQQKRNPGRGGPPRGPFDPEN